MSTSIETKNMAKLTLNGTSVELPVVTGTEFERAVNITKLRDQTGLITLDEGYRNTASVRSAITYINGEEGFFATAVSRSNSWPKNRASLKRHCY